MTVTRWAISLERQLAREIKRSAAGEPLSAWLADAARSKLRREAWAELTERGFCEREGDGIEMHRRNDR